MLVVREVSYTYPGKRTGWALRNFSLEVSPGEFVALVGPNGAGKSTLAKLLKGLLLPTEGEVWVDGVSTKDPAFRNKAARKVGFVFANPENQIVAPAVAEDIAFGLENLALPPAEIKARVAAALHQFGLNTLAHCPSSFLSGGQKQKVALAGVVVLEPTYLVCDEPTAMLDPEEKEEVEELLVSLCREKGLALILATHDMEMAARADRALVLNQGRLQREGSPAEIFSSPFFLKENKLNPPLMQVLSSYLRARGLLLSPCIFSVEEMIGALCSLSARK